MEFANQKWFDHPDTLRIAQGYQFRIEVQKDTTPEWIGGIINPRRVEIFAGVRLVRFSQVIAVAPAIGNWWIDWQEYKRIERFADLEGIGVGEAIRDFCCVPSEWSALDLVVQVQTCAPLLAFCGVGNTAFSGPRGTYPKKQTTAASDLGGYRVNQLFIPGLSSADVNSRAISTTTWGFVPSAS